MDSIIEFFKEGIPYLAVMVAMGGYTWLLLRKARKENAGEHGADATGHKATRSVKSKLK